MLADGHPVMLRLAASFDEEPYMMAQPRASWLTPLLLAAMATAIWAATGLGWRSWSPPHRAVMADPALVVGPQAHSVCVTPVAICASLPARSGDPCSCPNLLRGMVPGHVEPALGPPVLPRSQDWAAPPGYDSSDRSPGLAAP